MPSHDGAKQNENLPEYDAVVSHEQPGETPQPLAPPARRNRTCGARSSRRDGGATRSPLRHPSGRRGLPEDRQPVRKRRRRRRERQRHRLPPRHDSLRRGLPNPAVRRGRPCPAGLLRRRHRGELRDPPDVSSRGTGPPPNLPTGPGRDPGPARAGCEQAELQHEQLPRLRADRPGRRAGGLRPVRLPEGGPDVHGAAPPGGHQTAAHGAAGIRAVHQRAARPAREGLRGGDMRHDGHRGVDRLLEEDVGDGDGEAYARDLRGGQPRRAVRDLSVRVYT
mmetsp:Transcript_16535/g.35935  ORF Transcript_16535/g.35935 Transcript_16535/m.35935 type:complete len:279 (+) Transcript_16535:101-937(+)